jgi:hypothetical protein
LAQDIAKRLADLARLDESPQLRGQLDVANARSAGQILQGLLAANLQPDETAVAIAAVNYFLERQDAVPDNRPRGYRDDFVIARAVAWALGHDELYAGGETPATE